MAKLFICALLLCMTNIAIGQINQSAIISGSGEYLQDNDTVVISVNRYNFSILKHQFQKVYKSPIQNHFFKVVLPVGDSSHYVTIQVGTKVKLATLRRYLISPGDDIHLDFKDDTMVISGKQSAGFNTQYRFQQAAIADNTQIFQGVNFEPFLKAIDSVGNHYLEIFDSGKEYFSDEAWNILINDLISAKSFEYHWIISQMPLDEPRKSQYIQSAKKYFTEKSTFKPSANYSVNSINTAEYLLQRYTFDSCAVIGRPFELKRYLKYLSQNLIGLQKDKAVAYTLFNNRDLTGDTLEELDKAVNQASNTEFANIIKEFKDLKTDGVMAYDFSLTDIKGKRVHLSDFRGSPIILDFWFTGCVGCRGLAPYMKNIEQKFSAKNVKFIGISVDKDFKLWLNGIASEKYVSPNIINLMTNGNGNKDVVIDKYKIREYPSIFLIDKNGKLRNVKTDPRDDNGKSLIEMIKLNL